MDAIDDRRAWLRFDITNSIHLYPFILDDLFLLLFGLLASL